LSIDGQPICWPLTYFRNRTAHMRLNKCKYAAAAAKMEKISVTLGSKAAHSFVSPCNKTLQRRTAAPYGTSQ